MEVSMQMQALSFLLSVALGVVYGVLYDVIRFFRVVFFVDVRFPFAAREEAPRENNGAPVKKRHGALFRYLFVALGDFLFFAAAAVLMCVFFFATNHGQVRGFALLGAFLGFLVYYNTVGRLFIGICAWLASLCKRAVCVAFRLLGRLLRLLLRPLGALGRRIAGFLQKMTKPIVSRLAARYNEYKENKQNTKRRRQLTRRMERCGSVCRNGYDGSELK